ncbi:MAG TPA: chromosomal replication initiator protein DnaA [Solirubrobacteraceae bacterium]|nr:chromosomal replication initiator protein DnaA [Solirubrobacteraceae bacterium]
MELSAHLDVTTVWREIRNRLRRTLGDSMYSVWIEPLELDSLDEKTLILKAPGETEAWLRKRYGRVLDRCARAVLGEDIEVRFAGERPARAGAAVTAETGVDSPTGSLNPRYSFDQFVIGEGNRLAHAAALAVAEQPGQTYPVLFLYAPPGLGKSHLLHAIGNYMLTHTPDARVRYTTVEAFTNHFVSALAGRKLERFKQTYRDVDVLLIDDVQFLASKAKTAEEFFHTFNALQDRGRQLVITCDRLPSELDGVEERLRERFQAGLVADILPADLATRLAILRKRAALDGVPLGEDGVLELIAERVTENVRALEGALIRVVAFHSLTGQPIDLALTERVLTSMGYTRKETPEPARSSGREEMPTISIEQVQQTVASRFGLEPAALIGDSRAARVAWPRHLAIGLARELTGASLAEIGRAFGGRSHNTVLHSCRQVSKRLSTDHQSIVDFEELTGELRDGSRHDRGC